MSYTELKGITACLYASLGESLACQESHRRTVHPGVVGSCGHALAVAGDIPKPSKRTLNHSKALLSTRLQIVLALVLDATLTVESFEDAAFVRKPPELCTDCIRAHAN